MLRFLLARAIYLWGSLHRNFGNKSSFLREHRAAICCFSRAYEMDPTLRRARLDRAIILWREMGQLDEAITDFDALLDEDPEYGLALLNRALAAQEAGRYAAALADLEAYLRLTPEDEEYKKVAQRTAALLRALLQG